MERRLHLFGRSVARCCFFLCPLFFVSPLPLVSFLTLSPHLHPCSFSFHFIVPFLSLSLSLSLPCTDDELYLELQEDVSEECNNYGSVRSLVIPRGNYAASSSGGSRSANDESVGMAFVHFTHSEGAEKARQAVAGRSFNGNTVRASFYPEALFLSKIYVVPPGYDASDEVGGGGATSTVDESLD